MIEAVYFADSTGALVFEYLRTIECPHFSVLQGVITKKPPQSLPFLKINQDYNLYYKTLQHLSIYALHKRVKLVPENPLEPLMFLESLVQVLLQFFGAPLSLAKLESNNDTLTLILGEMIGSGSPNITDPNQVRELVPFKSLLLKLLDNVGNDLGPKFSAVGGGGGGARGGPTDSLQKKRQFASETSTPWRRTNLKYTTNEMFVDIVETIRVIMRPAGSLSSRNGRSTTGGGGGYGGGGGGGRMKPVFGSIDGAIEFTSHLTGVPELRLNLQTFGTKFEVPSLHACVRMDNTSNGGLTFIPPDGKVTLMQYQLDISPSRLGLVLLDLTTGLGAKGNEFEARLLISSHHLTTKIENLVVKVVAPESTVYAKLPRLSHGEWNSRGAGSGEWTIRSVATGTQPVLRGTLLDSSSDNGGLEGGSSDPEKGNGDDGINAGLAPVHCSVSYTCKGSVPLGIKVDSLKIISLRGLGESVKPYKGVKYITRAEDIVIRAV